MATSFKKNYEKYDEQNDVTIIGIGNEYSLGFIIKDILHNILINLKITLIPVIFETINFIFIGRFGNENDIITYSLLVLFINILGLSYINGILSYFDTFISKENQDENLNIVEWKYRFDCGKAYVYLIFILLSIFSIFSQRLLLLINFPLEISGNLYFLLLISIPINFLIILTLINSKLLKISGSIRNYNQCNFYLIIFNVLVGYIIFSLIADPIKALAINMLLLAIARYLVSNYLVKNYSKMTIEKISFDMSSLKNEGVSFVKSSTFYAFKSEIDYLFFACFLLISIKLEPAEFAINSIISNFMRLFMAFAYTLSLSFKYHFDFKNSANIILQYKKIFYIICAIIISLFSFSIFFFNFTISYFYTNDQLIQIGVDTIFKLYPFFFFYEVLIGLFEQSCNLRKKKNGKYNYYGLAMNCISIILFSPLAGLFAFIWKFQFNGVWISYFELLVIKFTMYLIINLFRF